MHTLVPRWPADFSEWESPNFGELVVRDARDVASYAENDPCNAWYTYPHVWHLDDTGRWRCCSKGSSLDSVRRFAEHPERLLDCRMTLLPSQTCPDNWVVLEPRHPWLTDRYGVSENDARAFLSLRTSLADFEINLLDVVVFDQECHWWSLHELTSGTTAWTFGIAPRKDPITNRRARSANRPKRQI